MAARDEKLEAACKQHLLDELKSVTFFAVKDAAVRATTLADVDADELKTLLSVFDDRDTTIGEGLVFGGARFETHRVHADAGLVYGRSGGKNIESGVGIGIVRVNDATFAVATWGYPTISANALPKLQRFCKEHVAAK